MSQVVKDTYDQLAPVYEERWSHYVQASLKAVVEGLHLTGDERVLDIACGTGALESELFRQWPTLQLFGTDLSLEMLRRARAKPDLSGVGWVQADVHRLPMPEGTFDLVVCANSFHYFQNPERALTDINRVLKPGGALVLVDWCDDYWICKLCSVYLRMTDPAFVWTYGLADCQSRLERAGLAIESAERFRISWLWGLMRLVGRRPD